MGSLLRAEEIVARPDAVVAEAIVIVLLDQKSPQGPSQLFVSGVPQALARLAACLVRGPQVVCNLHPPALQIISNEVAVPAIDAETPVEALDAHVAAREPATRPHGQENVRFDSCHLLDPRMLSSSATRGRSELVPARPR